MTRSSPIDVYVEEKPDVLIATALLRPYHVKVNRGGTSDSAIAIVVSTSYHPPEPPVAARVNAWTDNLRKAEEERAAMRRLIYRWGGQHWYAAMAVPRLDAWPMTDPRIRQDLEAFQGGKAFYAERAA